MEDETNIKRRGQLEINLTNMKSVGFSFNAFRQPVSQSYFCYCFIRGTLLIVTLRQMWDNVSWDDYFLCQTRHLERRSVTCTPTLPPTRKVWTSNSRRSFVSSNARSGSWREKKTVVSEHNKHSPPPSVVLFNSLLCFTADLLEQRLSSHPPVSTHQDILHYFSLLTGTCLIDGSFISFSQRNKPGHYIHRDSNLPSETAFIGEPGWTGSVCKDCLSSSSFKY